MTLEQQAAHLSGKGWTQDFTPGFGALWIHPHAKTTRYSLDVAMKIQHVDEAREKRSDRALPNNESASSELTSRHP